MNYPRYPEYKPSGVEWLGEVPAHWAETRLKNVASIRVSNVDKKSVEGQETVRLCNYVDVYYHDQITPSLEFMEATATAQQIEKFALKKGDVLITKDSETPDDIAVPSLVASDLDGVVCGYHLALIRPDTSIVEGAYLARAVAALGVRDQFHSAANGITRFGLSSGDISGAFILVPPLNEQRAIAAFLDRETARIDALIARKQRLIEMLAEKRTALISQAVTKGLTNSPGTNLNAGACDGGPKGERRDSASKPDAPMKDSGVEWLGEIPAHWKVSKLAFLSLSLQTGPFGSQLHSGEYVDDGIPVINPANIQDGSIVPDTKVTVTPEVCARLSRHELQAGDIIFGRRGEMGRCALVTEKEAGWLCGTGSLRVRLDQAAVNPSYLLALLGVRGIADYLSLNSVGSTMENLNTKILGSIPLVVPPLGEQEEIARFVEWEMDNSRRMIERVNSAVAALSEYRSSLISAAVTGKIDVRGLAEEREVA